MMNKEVDKHKVSNEKLAFTNTSPQSLEQGWSSSILLFLMMMELMMKLMTDEDEEDEEQVDDDEKRKRLDTYSCGIA